CSSDLRGERNTVGASSSACTRRNRSKPNAFAPVTISCSTTVSSRGSFVIGLDGPDGSPVPHAASASVVAASSGRCPPSVLCAMVTPPGGTLYPSSFLPDNVRCCRPVTAGERALQLHAQLRAATQHGPFLRVDDVLPDRDDHLRRARLVADDLVERDLRGCAGRQPRANVARPALRLDELHPRVAGAVHAVR